MEETKLLVTQGASIYVENKEEKTPLQATKGGLGLLLKRITESEAAWVYSLCFAGLAGLETVVLSIRCLE